MSLNTETSVLKSLEVVLDPGEIFVSFITDRKPNTDILMESYINTVFPVAIEHGARPLGNLIVDFVSRGEFNATDFVGLSKWQDPKNALAFNEVFPEAELNELRKPIWNDLKIVASPIKEKINFKLQEGKQYEYKLLWGSEDEIGQIIDTIELYSGKILLNLPIVSYSDLKGGTSPQALIIVEWENYKQAFDCTEQQEDHLRQEAVYTFYLQSIPKEQEVHTNNVVLEVAAAVDDVWHVLETGGDVDKWFPYITSCELIDNRGKLKRRCTTADGKTLDESIVLLDKENKILVYTVDSHDLEMPIENIRGIMRVKRKKEKTLIDWTVHFELTQQVDAQTLGQIQEGMLESMRVGIKGIEQYLN